jgi:hypothetical protein
VSRRFRHVRGRPIRGALALVLAGLGGCGSEPVQPAEPARAAPAPMPDATPVRTPTPSVTRPVRGTHERAVPAALAARAGRVLLLDVQVGGPPCDAVTAVDIDERRESVMVTVRAGKTPGARCGPGVAAILGTFRVEARLREPLGSRQLLDGARR